MNTLLQQLQTHIEQVPLLYNGFTPEQRLQRPAPGKWSRQEILGHLVDSALNNLKRFTDLQFQPQPYAIIPYQQDDLVRVNQYQQLPLEHLLTLWQSLNQQIVYVIQAMPVAAADYPILLTTGEQHTVAWWFNDYVEHLGHHLQQVTYNL